MIKNRFLVSTSDFIHTSVTDAVEIATFGRTKIDKECGKIYCYGGDGKQISCQLGRFVFSVLHITSVSTTGSSTVLS